jgi:hypothetical protein
MGKDNLKKNITILIDVSKEAGLEINVDKRIKYTR